MSFNQYIEQLCAEHQLIKHSESECHFSDLTEDFADKLKRIMHYPCVSLDTDGFGISGGPGNGLVTDRYGLYFVTHLRDTGNYTEQAQAIAQMRLVAMDFLKRMSRDKKRGVDAVARFTLDSTEGEPVYFKDDALYGWAISVLVPTHFSDLLCNNNFNL